MSNGLSGKEVPEKAVMRIPAGKPGYSLPPTHLEWLVPRSQVEPKAFSGSPLHGMGLEWLEVLAGGSPRGEQHHISPGLAGADLGQCLQSRDGLEEAGSSGEQTMLGGRFGDRNLEKCQAKLVSLGDSRHLGDSGCTASEQGQWQLQSRASYTLGQSQVVRFNLHRALFQKTVPKCQSKAFRSPFPCQLADVNAQLPFISVETEASEQRPSSSFW